jgi:hypothetical protein
MGVIFKERHHLRKLHARIPANESEKNTLENPAQTLTL